MGYTTLALDIIFINIDHVTQILKTKLTIMKKINNKLLVAFSVMVFLSSCNKEPAALPAIVIPPYPSGTTLAATIAANVNDSLYNRIIIKSGLAATLGDNTKTFTMFVPDNNALILSFGGSLAAANGAIASFSAATCAGIVSYNTVATKFPASAITTGYANNPLPSLIVLDPTQPFVRMPIFPSKRAVYAYVNNIPITAVDQVASNGIIHHTGALVQPLPASPTVTTLKTLINADANLTYFRAAITRADSGQVGISGVGAFGLKFDSLMNYPITNMTVLAPNNTAFQTLIFGLAYRGYLSTRPTPYTAIDSATALATANGAVAAGPAFLATNNVSTALIRGILAYHILASNGTGSFKPDVRAFSVNFSSAPLNFVTTLVNGSVAVHPGIMAQATFTGPVVSALKFTGMGTFPPGGAPFSGAAANATAWDRMALNGVLHVIDRVLLPQ